MIGFVDIPPRVEPHGGGFLVTVKSGETETAFLLTLHAMTALCGSGMARVKEAQAAQFVATPYQRKHGQAK